MSDILKTAALLKEASGFNAVDAPVAQAILDAPQATARQIRSLWGLLGRYRGRLEALGVAYETLVPPALPPQGSDAFMPSSTRVRLSWVETGQGRRIAISFAYDEQLIEILKKLKKTPASPPWYDGAKKAWVLPDDMDLYNEALKALGASGRALDFQVDPDLAKEVQGANEAKSRAYVASRASEAHIDVPTKIPLYPFQKAGVQWIEDRRGRALVADDMGTGKSGQALGYLTRHPEALPALVICPSTLKANWYKEVRKFTDFKPFIVSSKSSLKAFKELGIDAGLEPQAGYDIIIMNYDLLETETPRTWVKALADGDRAVIPDLLTAGQYALNMLQKALKKSSDHKVKARFLEVIRAIELKGDHANKRRYVKAAVNGVPVKDFLKHGFRTLICDESHYLKDFRAQRTLAVFEMAKKIRNVICLTGTPLLNRPKELWSQVYTINPRIFPRFSAFAERYCAAKQGRFGMDYSGASNLEELEWVLRSGVMIRRTKDQVMPELPPKVRITIPMVIDKGLAKYHQEAKEVLERLVGIKQERDAWKLLVDSKSGDERSRFLAEHAEESASKNRLTSVAIKEIEKLKLLAVSAKLDQVIKFVIDAHEQSGKIVVFMVHHDPIDRMVEALSKAGVTVDKIDGRVAGPAREPITNRFQTGDLDILVCGIRAASEGLTLTASHIVVTAELDWNWPRHLQCEDRVHRITQTISPTIYYLVAAGTIEEKIAALIDAKREVVHAAMGESYRTLDETGILDALLEDIVSEGRTLTG